MCGLAGIIFGKKQRRAAEREYLTWLFTRLLILSESRGPHATGIAWLNREGEHRLLKRPMPSSSFVRDKLFHEVLSQIDNKTTLLIGHTRWRTKGDEQNSLNNHPIRAGHVLGTHNGTIYNADRLFQSFALRRMAEVDSELLFRLADREIRRGLGGFKRHLSRCRGQISAVFASRQDPERVLVLKGNRPLEFRWNPRCRAVLYASDGGFLDAVITEPGWRELRISEMSLIVFRHEDLTRPSIGRFAFAAQEMGTRDKNGQGRNLG